MRILRPGADEPPPPPPPSFTLTYAADPNGAIEGEAVQTVEMGGSGQPVTAVPATGYHFDSWSDGVSTAMRQDDDVTDDISVTASFTLNVYDLNYTAGPGGTVNGAIAQMVEHGSDGLSVTAVADNGYHFVAWDDGVVSATRQDTGVTGDLSVTALFEESVLALTPESRSHDAAGATGQSIDVTANVSWSAVAGEDWIQIESGASGSEDGELVYAVTANTDAERTGTITFSGGGLTREFEIVQAAAAVEPGPDIAGRVALLVANRGSLSATEREIHFLLQAEGAEVDLLDAVAVSETDLNEYGVFVCMSYGGSSVGAAFTDAMVASVLARVETGARLFVNHEAGGGRFLAGAGLYAYGNRSNWYPALRDTLGITSYRADDPIFAGVGVFTENPQDYPVSHFHNGDPEWLMWRADNTRSYTGRTGITGSALRAPDRYLYQGFSTGFQVSAIGDRGPEWDLGAGTIANIGMNWTFDQGNRTGGFFGTAGRQILANIASLSVGSASVADYAYWVADVNGVPNLLRAPWQDGELGEVEVITNFEAPYAATGTFRYSPARDELGLVVRHGSNRDQLRFYLLNPDGSDLRQVSDIPFGPFDFSPDGNQVVFSKGDPDQGRNQNEVFILDLEADEATQILTRSQPRGVDTHKSSHVWLDDGRIMYSNTRVWSDYAGQHNIHVYDEGESTALASNTSSGDQAIMISPDGTKILVRMLAYGSSGVSYINWPQDDGQNVILPRVSSRPVPTGWDGNDRVFYVMNSMIYSVDLDGANERNLSSEYDISGHSFRVFTVGGAHPPTPEPETYTLTYEAGENGSIDGPTPQTVEHGADGEFVTAVPDYGYHFVQWSDGLTEATRQDLDVIEDLTFTAEFAINEYTLTYTAGPNGTLEGEAVQVVEHGSDGAAVLAVAADRFRFVQWSDGRVDNPRTDRAVTGDISVEAEFDAWWKKPDFVVDSVELEPVPTTTNQSFTAHVTIRNKGDIPGDAGVVRVWLSRIGGASVGMPGDAEEVAGVLAAGETQTLTFTHLTSPSTVGTHHFRAFVDADNITDEKSLGNNQRSVTYTLSAEGPAWWMKPDFIITEVRLDPSPRITEQEFAAEVTVLNKGDIPGDAGLLRVWVSRVGSSYGEPGDADLPVGMLDVGETRTFRFEELTAASTGGTHHFRAVVDADNITDEKSVGNNHKSRTYRVFDVVLDWAFQPDGSIKLTWNSSGRLTYRLLRTTNLADGFEVIAEGIAATPRVNTYIDENPPATGMLFYTIEIE